MSNMEQAIRSNRQALGVAFELEDLEDFIVSLAMLVNVETPLERFYEKGKQIHIADGYVVEVAQ